MLRKIISGGQTGADRGGLIAGLVMDLETGGTAPKGWTTENGPYPALGHFYGLKEGPSGYPARTRLNVLDSDGTLIMGDVTSPGSALTVRSCIDANRPHILNPTPEGLKKWLGDREIGILNVAGNRESKNPGIEGRTYRLLCIAIRGEVLELKEEQNDVHGVR